MSKMVEKATYIVANTQALWNSYTYSMYIKSKNLKMMLVSALVIAAGAVSFVGSPATTNTASAASLTTWQSFIAKKCSGGTADAMAACAQGHKNGLEKKCGKQPAAENQKYITCWRNYIKNNGGTAGATSTPYEEESPIGGAVNPVDCADITTNIIKCGTAGGDPVTDLLIQLINFLAVGVGIAVVGGIIWGGMLYASSNGDSAKVNQGKMAIVNSIIGLVLFIFMYAMLNFIVPGGLFR